MWRLQVQQFLLLMLLLKLDLTQAQKTGKGMKLESGECACVSEVEELRAELQEHNFQLEQSAKQTSSLQAKITELATAVRQRDAHIGDLTSNLGHLVAISGNCTQQALAMQHEAHSLRIATQTIQNYCKSAGKNLELVTLETGRYFFSGNIRANWFDALKYCNYHGLQFLSIESAKENEVVINKLVEMGLGERQRCWMSATDQGLEGRWFWASTGQEIVYSAWFPHQPDNYNGSQNCGSLWRLNDTIKWDDGLCTSKQHFICETSQMCLDVTGL